MSWTVKNIKDGRVILKHKDFDRFYVSDPIEIADINTELYTTDDWSEAYDVLEATKYHWAGVNVDGWRVIKYEELS